MLNGSAQTLLLIPALLVLLAPPAHVADYEVIGDEKVDDGTSPTPPAVGTADADAQYKDFPPLILEQIRHTARERWPGSPDAQAAMVGRQVRAYRYVMDTSDEYYPSVISRIAEDIGKKWPNDYERQEIYLRKQCEAYEAIRNYDNYRLPNSVIGSVKTGAAKRWPNDCGRQLQYLRREIERLE